MRTTLNIDDDLLRQVMELTGITEKAALLRESLKALIERESTRSLALLGWLRTSTGSHSPSSCYGRSPVILVDT